MSVDLHIPKRAVITVSNLTRRVTELFDGFVGHNLVPLIVVRQFVKGNISEVEPRQVGDMDGVFRVDLPGKTHVFLTYLSDESRPVYLVTLNVGQPAINVLFGVIVAAATCELGGIGIDDEGFISDGIVNSEGLLSPGRLIQLLSEKRPAVFQAGLEAILET
jgi:hypothetical protein